jgi:SOS response regulatory protein OraA/RecX
MTEDEAYKRLLAQAGSMLARRACSRGELCERLLRSADSAAVERVLDRLTSLNLLNDPDYAYNFASRRIKQDSWGPARVRHALQRRRVASDVAETAIERVRAEVSDEAVVERFLERSCRTAGWPRNRKEIQKMILRLRRRGFNDGVIFNTLRRKLPASAWELFESGE